jgi:ribonucleotide reductase beta subunit family protein with ferritin-like domain
MEPKLNQTAAAVEETLIPNILKPTESLKVVYPEAIDFTEKQLKVFWLPGEVKVEKDIQDIRVNMTTSERHGTLTTLKLFTLYELKAGAEYWGGRFKQRFPTHELQRMAATFAMFELAVHKPFYAKINELLFLDNDDFYSAYKQDPVLKARMDFIDQIIDHKDDLVSLGGFALIEGAILYSAFGYLKHFQSRGKNKALNVVRGINFSVRDENLHSIAGAWTFRKLMAEKKELMNAEDFAAYSAEIKRLIFEAAEQIFMHESYIVDDIFSQGEIEGITALQLKNFVKSRINLVLVELGYEKLYEVTYNPIAEWFYDSINSFTFNDTFSGVGNSYHREWSETDFLWNPKNKNKEVA